MKDLFFILKGLSQNISLFLALSYLYGFLLSYLTATPKLIQGLTNGLAFSLIAGLGMMMHIELIPGSIIDGRLILVGTAGAYGGPVSAITSALLVSGFRIFMGGGGAALGCAGILGGGLIGVWLWHKKKSSGRPYTPGILMLTGLILTLQAQLWVLFFLPLDIAWPLLKRVSIPGILFYPLGTLLLGSLLNHNLRNEQLTKSLKDDEEKYRTLFERESHAIFIFDPATTQIIEANEATAKMYGYDRNELIGMPYLHLNAETNASVSAMDTLHKTDTSDAPQHLHRRKDGSIFPVDISGYKITLGGKEMMYAVSRDITRHRKAEEKLKWELKLNQARVYISRELMSQDYDIKKVSDLTLEYSKALTDSGHGFVSSIDETSLKNQGLTLTGMFSKQCKMKKKETGFPIGDDGKYSGLWGHGLNTKKAFFTNQPERHPQYPGTPQGHVPLENFLAVPVMMGENLLGLIALANSDRDYTEQDLTSVQHISEIFALAIHRYKYETQRILMEQNLRQLQKVEAIGALAGGIAHDFNNILFPIIGYAEILAEDFPKDSPDMESINEILIGAKRAKSLVDQILTFSRQTDHKDIPLKPDLILKEVIKLIRSTLPATIKVEKYIDPKCRMILADPTQIHQVAMNLITNAYHSMQALGGTLTIKLQNIEDIHHIHEKFKGSKESFIRLSVKDTGTGMNRYTREKIFDPYFTTKPKGKGTGLGLSVIHGIVKNYHGQIMVKSIPDSGSTFDVYFPALREKNSIASNTEDLVSGQGNEHILVVDDEHQILRLEKKILERLGYKVTTEDSSLNALKLVNADPKRFDLIITDMTMPDMTGDLLAQEIKNIIPGLPIIICTGFSERISLEKVMSIGAKGLLHKPIIKSEFTKMVRSVLDKEKNLDFLDHPA